MVQPDPYFVKDTFGVIVAESVQGYLTQLKGMLCMGPLFEMIEKPTMNS